MALQFQKNGSYLVVRKIGEDVATFNSWLDEHKVAIANVTGSTPDEARAHLKAAIMGRDDKGDPLVDFGSGGPNDFNYGGDRKGLSCPHSAHIRRANPRRITPEPAPVEEQREFDRPTPRIVRRGMLFGKDSEPSCGLMFMAYAASISEQYEVIQRWLNGGNPTDVASDNHDPLTGVRPKEGDGTFRFVHERTTVDGVKEQIVLSIPLPAAVQPLGRVGEPGRHPFTPLYWGLYLFAPSRAALGIMTKTWTGEYKPLGEFLEQAVGAVQINRLEQLTPEVRGGEWKRILEELIVKDPTERDISPHVWSAIRLYAGGVLDLDGSVPFSLSSAEAEDQGNTAKPACSKIWSDPDWKQQNVVLCAGASQVMQVLADWKNFTSEEQLRRIKPGAGPIYVTQQPDNDYICPHRQYHFTAADGSPRVQELHYSKESAATNAALLAYPEEQAFLAGYQAGKTILDDHKKRAEGLGRTFFKLEMRREYFQPAISEIWRLWYGLPDDKTLFAGSWSWKRIVDVIADADTNDVARTEALCPGDFMAPSRGSVFPRPNDSIRDFAQMHGAAILKAGRTFVRQHRKDSSLPKTPLIATLFAKTSDDEVLARNIIGTMIGAIPPMEANLRNILFEWLHSKRLWRYQTAFRKELAGKSIADDPQIAMTSLTVPVSQAMCLRPAPDMLFRTAKGRTRIVRYHRGKLDRKLDDAWTKEGDMIIVSLASASQWELQKNHTGTSGIDVIFGGKRQSGSQGYLEVNGEITPDPNGDNDHPVHACPAQKMAMGGMKGILAALLEAGTIQALPASLILRISDWA